MRWPWQKKIVYRSEESVMKDPFEHSPFNSDTIRPGDPGWEIIEESMRTGKPVTGIYNGDTGEIISMSVDGEETNG